MSPTDQSRKIEVIRAYNSLKIYDKGQTVDRFLYEWERIYGIALTLNLPDVLEDRPIYDFAIAIRSLDVTYATNLELRIDENIRKRQFDSSIQPIKMEDVFEEFRHYYNRRRSNGQRHIPASFVTAHENNNLSQKKCVCGSLHLFKECLYLNPSLRPLGWSGRNEIYHQINQALADPRRIKIRTLITRTTEYDGSSKGTGKEFIDSTAPLPSVNTAIHEKNTEELLDSYRGNPLSFASLAAIDSVDSLTDSWILDGGSDIHICNNSAKWNFQTTRQPREGEFIRAGNSTIPIEAYGNVKINVDTPTGEKHITLKNVALAHSFLTNIVSMQLLNKSGLHWSSRKPDRLEFENQSLACQLYQNGGHTLFNNPESEETKNTNFGVQSSNQSGLRTFTEAKLHKVLAHASTEVMSHINGPDYNINIDKSDPAPKTIRCVSCSLSKSKRIVSRIWIPSKNKVIRTRDVTFDDTMFYNPTDLDLGAVLSESAENIIQTLNIPNWSERDPEIEEIEDNNVIDIPSNLTTVKAKDVASKTINSDIDVRNIIHGKRTRKHVTLATFHNSFASAKDNIKPKKLHRSELPPPPKSHREVIRHTFSAGFRAAEEKELQTLFDKKLFSVINKCEVEQMKKSGELDADKKTLPLMWIYTYKFDADGYLLSFKARLVARGDLQKTTEETYATTLAAQVFRAIMAISAAFNYKIRQYDIVAAYTNADLSQPIVAYLPDGYHQHNKFLLVKKALYGLPESALLWQTHFQSTLFDIGLNPVPGVNCLFRNEHTIVLFYVDDIILIHHERNTEAADEIEFKIMQKYQTKPLGPIDHFLGIRVVRDEQMQKIWLVQDSYIESIAKQFNIVIENTEKPSTPLPTSPLIKNLKKATAQEIHEYQKRVGKLNYAAVITRPDISYGVSKLSEFLQNPSSQHIEAAQHMIKYLVATKYRGIEYSADSVNSSNRAFVASSDASFADNVETRLLQKETPKLATKLKHVDIHQCWLRQEVQSGTIQVEWIETSKMIADGFTKQLPPQRHRIFVEQMGLIDVVTN
ncbi:Reverse transcriptase family protein [Thalictrum thalictroides]|uniref:Reverse transcriptase family protein n=1 Tax=Thalictrum thalictroides TaxID=46969 RepID=A0A7J6WSV2_THATH|nr:Reverse transcriptase family protein [Thalictrum thalictroides]